MKVIVIGAAQSGKSTIAQALAERMATTATDTSAAIVAIETERQVRLAEARVAGTNVDPAPLLALMHRTMWDEERNRPTRDLLIALGDALKIADQTILGTYCFARGQIAIGVRRREELAALRLKYPDAHVIYVEAPGTVPDNFDITTDDLDDLDLVILNRKEGLHQIPAIVDEVWGFLSEQEARRNTTRAAARWE